MYVVGGNVVYYNYFSCRVEVEQNLLNRKFKTLTAYYGELVDDDTNNYD